MQHRFRRSELELHGPWNVLKLVSEAPEGCIRIRIRHRTRRLRRSGVAKSRNRSLHSAMLSSAIRAII
eukprot:1888216-Alexandrium_andersonii.AAC.1